MLAPGLRADAILVDDSVPGLPRVCGTIVNGELKHATRVLPMIDIADARYAAEGDAGSLAA
ncbi:hypothetical protein D3C72_1660130 [compost metagenome]